MSSFIPFCIRLYSEQILDICSELKECDTSYKSIGKRRQLLDELADNRKRLADAMESLMKGGVRG